jgi:tetrapyrrole methylase family protein / MazG family protein
MSEIYKTRSVEDLQKIMTKLLSPEGCPWDREQSPKTLAPFAIEEAFELAEAIDKNDLEGIKEELGDVLLQVIFHSTLAQNAKQFTLADVIETVCTKLIRRHPHVFPDASGTGSTGNASKVQNAEEVLTKWNEIKKAEKKDKVEKGFGIPVGLPALQRAQKIGDKTKALKFDWDTPEEVLAKVDEEISELKEALDSGDLKHAEEELGDVFFVLAQLARKLKFEAESVARRANQKFETRFEKMLELAFEKGLVFSNLNTKQMEDLWTETKESLKAKKP